MRLRHLAVAAAAALAGCTVGPDYAPPPLALPQAWVEATATLPRLTAEGYLQAFADPVLLDLVRRAVAANPDIEAARARVAEARSRAGAAGSARWPQVDAAGSFSNSRLSEHGFLEGLGTGAPGGSGGAVFPGQQIDLYQAGFDASWEIDVFGGQRREVEAATADADAALAEARGVLLGLQAATAEQYLQWRGWQQLLQLAERQVQVEQDALDVLAERAAAGVADRREVAHQQQALATQQARVQAQEAQQQTAVHGLERLLGLMPGRLEPQLLASAPLPSAPDPFAIDLPAAVLQRRPDVQAAERRLHAATARIGVATADLYPRLSLTGAFGLQAQHVEDVPDLDSRFWAIGPQLRWPLFDFGRVEARIAGADARAQQALASYRGTVLQALTDVEVALVRLQRGRQQTAALQRAVDAAGDQERLAHEQYDGGVIDYLLVVQAQRERIDAEDALLRAQLAIDLDVVALGKAIGGGWDDAAPTVDKRDD